MAGQLDKKGPIPGEVGEPGRPDGSGEAHPVQHHQRRSCSDAEHTQPHPCRGEVEERLLGLQAGACEQPGLRRSDPSVEFHALLPFSRAATVATTTQGRRL